MKYNSATIEDDRLDLGLNNFDVLIEELRFVVVSQWLLLKDSHAWILVSCKRSGHTRHQVFQVHIRAS